MGALWPSGETASAAPQHLPQPERPTPRKGLRWRAALMLTVFLLVVALGLALAHEARTSWLQARELSEYAASLDYHLAEGPSNAILFPRHGPFDRRLGYSQMPLMLYRLRASGYQVTRQARFSPALLDYSLYGFFPPFDEKTQAGLNITDSRGQPLYSFSYPRQVYRRFDDIPPVLVQTLLFIENRHLLDERPQANPAVDWPRLAQASLSQLAKQLELQGQAAGGSTLATQLEKYRHSPQGQTFSAGEKARQMVSASVRAYQAGSHTLPARQRIARDYLNSVPLSAAPGHGEVHGLADGLRIWFGADFNAINRSLAARPGDAPNAERGLALRQVLALIIAQRRPSWYLFQGRKELDGLIDSHLRLLASQAIIDTDLRDAALANQLVYKNWSQQPNLRPNTTSKGINVARSRLSGLLGVPFYDLDRLDLSARTTLDGELQQEVGDYLRRLADPAFAEQLGLFGERLLSPQTTAEVRYSFTLFENSAQGALVRVQTDNTDQPFDLNEDSKLELGSTAKLRVLTTYLEVIAELHQRFAGQSRETLLALEIDGADHLTRWARDYLLAHPANNLTQMLDAALERRYSASPHERFFTGGGLHSFGNFRREDDGRNPTLRDALRESINLPFIRLMRDLVRYSIYQAPGNSAALLKDDQDPRRDEYLRRFADREGKVFLMRFWRKYQDKPETERLHSFLEGLRATPVRLAAVHRYLFPDASPELFEAFLEQQMPGHTLSAKRIEALYDSHGPGAWSLPDQGYIARVHPLELWLLGYLNQHPNAGFSDAVSASDAQRQEVYGWLFKTRHKSARDIRIRTMLEVEAFLDIHERWQRVGYPFDHLVPSLATAIGSSGDRPAALAELIGIIQNDGIRQPALRIDRLHFAAGTPYETLLQPRPEQAVRVLPAEVAAALRAALSNVVEDGTARRLQGSFTHADGSPLALGGKTGTGDNRIEQTGRGGRVLSSTAINRTATFVFYIGPRHFGTLTAFVPGRAADEFRFTSALPVQVFKGMAPVLSRYLEGNEAPPRPPVVTQLAPGTRTAAQ